MHPIRSLLVLIALCFTLGLPARAQTAPAPLVEGTDYVVVRNGKPWQPVKAGDVEVVEVFAYTCGHCAHFEPILAKWMAQQPATVRVVLQPAAFDPQNPAALAAYAAQQAGIQNRVHPALFKAIHADRSMPMNATIEEYAAFMAPFGSTPAKLEALMRAPTAKAQLERARDFQSNTGVTGTPTMIVNGRYVVQGRSFEDQIDILNRLIAQIRGGKL